MEQAESIIIPTGYRQKISHLDSYPIGAEKISLALADTIQLPNLVLYFRPDYGRKNDAHRYRFLQIGYSSLYAEWATHYLNRAGLPAHSEWQIEVFPVPRLSRHRIQQYILTSALAEVKVWLDTHTDRTLQGSSSLSFFYNEETEECTSVTENYLQPARVRA